MESGFVEKEVSKKRGFFRKVLIVLAFFILYLVTSVPVGLFLYSMKQKIGIDVFSETGFHSYMQCLREQAEKIE